MLSLEEIIEYIDGIIDSEANNSKDADRNEKSIATGIIMSLEDFKDWLQEYWEGPL